MQFRLVFLLLFSVSSLCAHPHIFIDVKMTIESEKTTITWIFDAMSSAMLIKDYDKNKDKQEINEEKEKNKPIFLSSLVYGTNAIKEFILQNKSFWWILILIIIVYLVWRNWKKKKG